ncbi:hypothetical protein [Desulfonatronovibrio magnus]|uniref:hypothetical protein n=1 Tax=Desulfonatronovibrio magnus TaxID=698827 RepID=UPI0005EB00B0|nr:hypothetical protein [Desulfonatronovibrio magnus]
MSDKRLHLKKAEQSLHLSLKEDETIDDQLKQKILRAISEVQGALEIIRKRESKKYHHDSGDDDDMWVV